MKIKSLFIILFVAGIASALYLTKQTEVLADYSSRMTQEALMSPEGRDLIYQSMKSNLITGKIEGQDYLDMKKAVNAHLANTPSNKSIEYTWAELGPDNFGGRTRAILPVGENVVFAGSVSGGLWKSENQGLNWAKVNTDFRIVGSLGKTANGDIYVGTGSQFETPDGNGQSGFIGEGLFYSNDGGNTFTVVPGTVPNFMAPSDGWSYINALAGDGAHPDRIWFASKEGVGYVENGNEPVMVNNGLGTSVSGQDIDISADGSTIIVAVNNARIRISTDGGENFIQANTDTDLPSSGGRRARVAVSSVDPNYMYVLYANSGFPAHFGGLWQTQNGGDSWEEIVPEGIEFLDITNNQAYYDLALAIDPTDPTKVFMGGLTLWKAGTGVYPEQITTYGGFGPQAMHPDLHEIVFSDDNRMYVGCDGGVYGSSDIGQTFFPLNTGYNTMTFYNMAQSSGLNGVIGGAQDNGTIYIPGDGTFMSDLSGIVAGGGDGFGCEISLVTSGLGVAFLTSQYGNLYRAVVDEQSPPSSFYDQNIVNRTGLSDSGEAGPFYSDIALFEDTEDEDSQHTIEIINPHTYDYFDPNPNDDDLVQLSVQTNNKNIEFLYTLEDTLHYWPEIVRPAIVTLEPLTQDPNYWFLDAQPLDYKDTVCVDELVDITIDTIIGSINPILFCDTSFVNDTIINLTDTLIVDTFFVNCVTIGYDTLMTTDTTFTYEENCHFEYHYLADVVVDVKEHKLIKDPYTSLFAIGFRGDEGIWITREALNYNVSPSWMRVVDNAPLGGTNCLTFSHDGDRMYYSGWGSQSVFEVSGLDSLYTAGEDGYTGGDIDKLEQRSIRTSAGAQITGIACDYFNPDHMVISLGNYGTASGGKIQETWNATSDNPTWSNIWFPSSNNLVKMPCYDVIIDRSDATGSTIVVGTEFGIFATSNGGDDWVAEINDPTENSVGGIDRTPVFELRQQVVLNKRWWHPQNTGAIYAATHGRGMFRSDVNLDGEVSVSEIEAEGTINSLSIYPNPASTITSIDFELQSIQDVVINIFSIQGELVKTISKDNLSRGRQSIQLDVEELLQGNYILQLEAGDSSKIGKFMIIK